MKAAPVIKMSPGAVVRICFLFLAALGCRDAAAQVFCPSNINFELGNLSGWSFDTATNGGNSGIVSAATTAPITGRHTLTSGTTTDYYGGFPILDPVGGTYSLKLGNDRTGAQVDRAKYTITIPSNVNNYSLIYRYAVVLENPAHSAVEQPYFKVRVYNASTNATINCASFTYVSAGGLPGFSTSTRIGNHVQGAVVYYKNWATNSLNLSGHAGDTLVVEFTAADCSLGAHMGYGYIDMSCGLFAVSAITCSSTSPLTAPQGFQTYTWYNANYSAVVDTGRTITVATPAAPTQYHVVLTPYPGYGCQDTLTTQIVGSSLAMNAGPDTSLCNNSSVVLHPTVQGNAAPYTYSWSPSSGLSCSSCANPSASPSVSTNYIVTVTDSFGCSKADTVLVTASPWLIGSVTNATCTGTATGTATVFSNYGTPPYSYTWNTSPAQTGGTATALTAGTYTATITDSKGCTSSKALTVGQPTAILASIVSADSVTCPGGSTGRATGRGAGGTPPYSYSWSSVPLQTGITATALPAGQYVFRVTDSLGCSDTEQVSIAEPPALLLSPVVTNVICHGGNSGAIAASGGGGSSPYTYALNAGSYASTTAFPNLGSGVYTVRLKDARGCTKDSIVQVVEPAVLTAALTGIQPLCNGGSNGSVSIAGAGGNPPYQYAIGTGTFGTAATFAGLSAGRHQLHVRDNLGCVLDTSFVLAQPTPVIVSPVLTNIDCAGAATGAISVAASGGASGYAYAIDAGVYSVTSTFGGLSAGVHILHVRDGNGCIADSAVTLTQRAPVQIAYTTTPPLCNGAANGVIAITGSGGTGPYQYALNAGAYGSATSFSGLATGTYVLHVRDANGCSKDSTITLTQPSAPAVSVTTTPVACFGGATGAAQATASGGTLPYSYSWTGSTATTATASGLSAGSYTVTVTDSKGCTASGNATVSQSTAIVVSSTATPPLCSNSSNGSATVAVSGGAAPYTYSWSTSPAQTSATASALPSGTYTATIADALGCVVTRSVTVPVTQPVVVTVAAFPTSCKGSKDGFAIATPFNGNGPYSYTWNTSPVQTRDSATRLAAGSYAVTVTSADGCTAAGSVTITEPDSLRLRTVVSNTCSGFRTGRATVTATGGNGNYQYRWLLTPVQTNASATGLDSGAALVLVSDDRGCTDSALARIGVFQPPVVTLAADPDTICRGSSVQLVAGGAVSYWWYPSGVSPCNGCMSTSASPVRDTFYTVIGTDGNGCRDTAVVTVYVMQRTSVTVGPKQIICEGDSVRLSSAGGVSRYWLPGASTDSSILVRPNVTTTFQVVIRENRCFTDTLRQLVEVLPKPVVDLGPDLEALLGAVIRLSANVSYASSITWIPPAGLSCTDCFEPEFTLREKTSYIAKVSNALGCSATDTVRITDICDERYFYFANMFTPNSDGQNDRFYPQGVGTSRVEHFMIYDRWGEIVFSAANISVNDPLAGWDGTFRNQLLKPDVYVYVMDAICESGKKMVIRGDVTLIR